jgi:NOL1/NOP2/fmu family ribosome biogenesis protein
LRKKGATKNLALKSKKHYVSPNKKVVAEVAQWVSTTNNIFIIINEDVVSCPEPWQNEMEFFSQHLRVVSFGTKLAALKYNKLVPAHELAMSINLNRNQFTYFELDYEQAIKYLRKDSLKLDVDYVGYALVGYKNHTLGWVNILSNRVNNIYPKEWRIRMDPNYQ